MTEFSQFQEAMIRARLVKVVRVLAEWSKAHFKVEIDGRVSCGQGQAIFPVVAHGQSSAANAATLAVTTLSQAVYLFALADA